MPKSKNDQEHTAPSVSPALVGAAVYEGIPRVLQAPLGDVPFGLASLITSGKPIKADFDTPLKRIAEFTNDEVRAINEFARKSDVKIPIVAAGSRVQSGYFYDPSLIRSRISSAVNRILGGPQPKRPPSHIGLTRSSVPAAFHEIGHASPVMGSHAARRVAQGISSLIGLHSPIGAAARYGIVANLLVPPDDDSSSVRQFAYEHGPELIGATLAPELLEEGRASLHALKGARRHGIGTLRAIRDLAPNFGTYLTTAAAPVIAALVAKKVVNALRKGGNDDGQEKRSSARAGAEVKAPGVLRTSAASAWKIGGPTPPKPKSIKPNTNPDALARTREPAKPPSNRAYYKDLLKSLYNPQRGFRISVAG